MESGVVHLGRAPHQGRNADCCPAWTLPAQRPVASIRRPAFPAVLLEPWRHPPPPLAMIGSIQHRLAATLALATLAAPSFAQSEIHGVNLFGSTTYSAMSDDFLGTWFPGGPASSLLYGIDFDATATTLYGVESGTLNVFTFDWMGTGAPCAGWAVPRAGEATRVRLG